MNTTTINTQQSRGSPQKISENFKKRPESKSEVEYSAEGGTVSPNPSVSRRIENPNLIDVKKIEIRRAGTRGDDSIVESHYAVESHDTRDTKMLKGIKPPASTNQTAAPSNAGSKPYSDAVSFNQGEYGFEAHGKNQLISSQNNNFKGVGISLSLQKSIATQGQISGLAGGLNMIEQPGSDNTPPDDV